MQGLSFNFAVRCNEPALGRYVESLLAPLRAPVRVEHWYSLVQDPAGDVDLFLDSVRVERLVDARTAVAWLLWDLNRAVVDASPQHLLFHAGGVQAGDIGVLVPAPSGSGKSTLVAGLLRAGLSYLSDEVIAVTSPDATMLPYLKPLGLKRGSFGVLPDLRPESGPDLSGFAPADHWYLDPRHIGPGSLGGPCRPGLVVLPRYDAGAPTALQPLPPAEAFLALAVNTVNFATLGDQATGLLGRLVEQCETVALTISDLDEACRLVLGLLEERGVSVAG